MSTLTTYMSLTAWTDEGDPYSHVQLANNFNLIDGHDHGSNGGRQIPTAGLADHAVTQVKLADGAVGTVQVLDHAVTAAKLDVALLNVLVPMGVVYGCWRPAGSSTVYWGNRASGLLYEVCDGRTLVASEHDMGGGSLVLPNLIDKFALYGIEANIGVTGGSNSVDLAHTHTVNAHSHTVSPHTHTVNPHHHTITDHEHGIAAVTDHAHTWEGGKSLHSRRNAFIQADSLGNPLEFRDTASNLRHNDQQSLYVAGYNPGLTDDHANMDGAGGHDHGGATGGVLSGAVSGDTSPSTDSQSPGTDSQSPGTNSQLGSTENRPAFMTLVPMMRVRNP